jgi:hypothetical protein
LNPPTGPTWNVKVAVWPAFTVAVPVVTLNAKSCPVPFTPKLVEADPEDAV